MLACALAPSSDAAAVLLDAALAALPPCARASLACPRTHPSPAGAAAHAAHAPAAADPVQAMAGSAHADPSSSADPPPSPDAGGAWAAAAAAARCEAAWACVGGGGAAGRLARAERLHAAARMAWLERVREDAGELPVEIYAHVCIHDSRTPQQVVFKSSNMASVQISQLACKKCPLLDICMACQQHIFTYEVHSFEQCGGLLSGHVVADSVTAGGRVRRRRGFRSYITSTLALPPDAAASLALVGSSLAARTATALDAS